MGLFFFIVFFLVGILFFVLGMLIWKKQKINLIHDYHLYDIKDYKGYGDEMGKALCVLGGFIAINGAIGAFVPIGVTLTIFFVGFIIIFVTMYFIQKKYSGHGF